MRGLVYDTAAAIDTADRHADKETAAAAQRRVDLLIPVCKAWCTDTAVEICSTNIQVHGGMGFIEETGAAQHHRDARILPIYEGANGVQALDLVGRKVARDGGAAMGELIADIHATLAELSTETASDPALNAIHRHLSAGVTALSSATEWVVATMPSDPAAGASQSAVLLRLLGLVVGGWIMARSALAARAQLTAGANGDARYLEAKLVTVRHYADHVLAQAPSLLDTITAGGATVMALAEDQF